MVRDLFPASPETLLLPPGLHWPREFAEGETIGDLLLRLGHHCRGQCPSDPYSLEGLICVIPRRKLQASVALVLIDLTDRPEPLIEMFRVLRAINNCAKLERIRVVPGCGGFNGTRVLTHNEQTPRFAPR